MEVAGLAIGVISVIKPTAEAIVTLWSDTKNFGGDAERFRSRFSLQITRLNAFERMLFEANKFPHIQGRLFDQLPENVCENFVDLLRQLYDLLEKYYVVQNRYSLDGSDESKLVGRIEALDVDERRSVILGIGKAGDAKSSKGTNWTKKAKWIMTDKKSTEKLVTEFEAWTERVKSLLELAWWPLPFFSTVSQMEKLEEDKDASQSGMLEGIGMRKLLAAGSSQISIETAKSLKISRLKFTQTTSFQELEVGEIDGNRGVIVEYKNYEQDRTGSINEIVSRRILQLVALLHETKNDRFRILRCINFFDDVPGKRIGFVFENPVQGIPASLNSMLISKRVKPGLGARMKLAYSLAESLGHLHSVGWVHKSLRSENIIFLPGTATGQSTVIPEIAILEQPRVFGFEYSRLDSDFSSGRPDYDIKRNIYRHPQRWGQPSETFSKIHDIYGISSLATKYTRARLTGF
ncbi:hypothetical protein V490_02408 [Pseudogymnoascus sp. VKM F-3557]|nr:hypothetical protein V490_02408 [Pseudogymnoascus sp. VKM F-3557]